MILITGSAGFIGFHTALHFLKKGKKVVGIDNLNNYYDPKFKKKRLSILKKDKNFHFINSDLKKDITYKKLNKFKKKIIFIIHLAGQAGVRYSFINPYCYVNDNIYAYIKLLEYFKNSKKIRKLIYASSSSVYGDTKNKKVDKPISMYAITKKSMELISTLYSTNNKMKIFGVRFFTVYGSYSRPDMSLYKFAKNISTGKPIDVFNKGNHFRSFTYIDDVIFNLERLINFKSNKSFAKVVSIGNPRSVNLMYYISLIEKMINKKSIKKMLPKQKGDVQKSVNNKVREKRFYGFKYKISIEQGVKNFFEWYDKKEI